MFMDIAQTYTEDYIKNLYDSINIYKTAQFDVETISNRLGVNVEYVDCDPQATILGSEKYIFLNCKASEQENWQSFGRELCHVLHHEGNQFGVSHPFSYYQELKTLQFMYKFCAPMHMMGLC